jgi:hypothetical protein
MNRRFWIVTAMVLAAMVRVPAAAGLPLDADEPVYLRVSTQYAQAIRALDGSGIADRTENPEHPALVKLMHGAAIATLGDDPNSVERLGVSRAVSIAGGMVLAGLLAAVHPVAGLTVAVHTLHAKYTAQGYLEAWPMVWMFAGMMLWWRGRADHRTQWAVGFGLLWGLTGAGKVLHALPGILMAMGWAWRRPRLIPWLFGLPIVVFIAFNPALWSDLPGGLNAMMEHHLGYAAELRAAGTVTGPWAPLWFLALGQPAQWHPDVFPLSVDGGILVLGLVGLIATATQDSADRPLARMALAWFVLGLAVLMAWPTRWPQHALLLVPPICLGLAWFANRWGRMLSRASRRFAPSD